MVTGRRKEERRMTTLMSTTLCCGRVEQRQIIGDVKEAEAREQVVQKTEEAEEDDKTKRWLLGGLCGLKCLHVT